MCTLINVYTYKLSGINVKIVMISRLGIHELVWNQAKPNILYVKSFMWRWNVCTDHCCRNMVSSVVTKHLWNTGANASAEDMSTTMW